MAQILCRVAYLCWEEPLWPEAGVHHASLSTAERHDGTPDQITEGTMRPPSSLRKPGASEPHDWRLDPGLLSQTSSSSACHAHTKRGIQISSLT